MSNDPGCNFGYEMQKDLELLEAAFANERKADSKRYTGIETYIVALRDVKFPKDEAKLREVETMAKNAVKESGEAKAGFKYLIYTVLAGMIGLMTVNVVNQLITSKGMNKLYTVLEKTIEAEVKKKVGP